MNRTPDRSRHLAAHLVIFLAGFTFLIYEVSWNRLLSLVLGTTVTASTVVLASFMAGFGAGAFYWGKAVDRHGRPRTMLAMLLGAVGLTSAVDYLLIAYAVPGLYPALSGSGPASSLPELLVFGVAAGLLMVPAFLMGGVFPIISKIAIRSDGAIASSLGRLYAFETLGSSLGGLATGFVFLGLLGQRNTMGLAVVINLALAVWLLLTHALDLSETAVSKSLANEESPETHLSKSRGAKASATAANRRIALAATAVCGFAMFSLQVLWLRMFRIYFTNTSYTFALVASLVILGLFIGSFLFEHRSHRITNYARSMVWTIMLMGVSTALGLLLLIYLPDVLMFPLQSVFADPLSRILLLPLTASLLIVFPPALFSGYAFPLACRMYATGYSTISIDVGLVLTVNTVGCVIGPIAAAFLLIPILGAAVSVLLVLAVLALATLYILHQSALSLSTKLIRGALCVATAGLLVTTVFRPEIRILPPSFSQFDRDVLFYRESVEGTLSVGRDRDDRSGARYTYVNNSAVIGSTYDAIKVVKMVGHLPFLTGGECKNVLVIGFGIGVTTSAIASHPEVESIECVELVAGLKEAAVYYRDLNRNVAEDPRLKIISGDGRHYLQRTSQTYDLISCDPTHPILGSGNLYTKEYFSLCREHLNPGGAVSQYLPLHKLRTEELIGIIGTFHAVFPNCTVWLGHHHAVLLGRIEPIHIDFGQWAARGAAISQDPYFYSDPHHLAATLVLDGPTIARLDAAGRINSDDRSYTEFFAPSCLDEDNLVKNLRFLMEHRTDVGAVFDNIDDPVRMARFVQGNQLLTESLVRQMSGDSQRSLQALREACRVNPEDQEYPLLIRLQSR